MNLNNVMPVYSKDEHAIILLKSHPETVIFGRRVAHQEVLDAMVQYLIHDGQKGELKINSRGKSYILRMTECK